MNWTFESVTGSTYDPRGTLCGKGYAGRGIGKNTPLDTSSGAVDGIVDRLPDRSRLEEARGIGPIPVGLYRIGPAIDHPRLGPLAMPLVPLSGTETYGRSGFFIHADSLKHAGQASEGCVCLPHDVREVIASSSDRVLRVVDRLVAGVA
jgi:hypothetical protein